MKIGLTVTNLPPFATGEVGSRNLQGPTGATVGLCRIYVLLGPTRTSKAESRVLTLSLSRSNPQILCLPATQVPTSGIHLPG